QAGLPTTALITDMDQPLASAAGNAVEVQNAVDFLTGEHRDPRLLEVVVALGSEMLLIGGLARDAAEGGSRIRRALDDGAAAETFSRMVVALGGPADLLARPDAHLPAAPVIAPVGAERAGVVAAIDTRAVGLAVIALGGGRTRAEDRIDPAVGLTQLAGVGTRVSSGDPLCLVHARNTDDAETAARAVRLAYTIGETAPESADPVLARIGEHAAS
ncbi:MAG: thymidine phosphorylase, partial [Methylobacteriaceae bacterium]|nr:thymidine phosphorylase [Methylobacteriaceae bacterium]